MVVAELEVPGFVAYYQYIQLKPKCQGRARLEAGRGGNKNTQLEATAERNKALVRGAFVCVCGGGRII